MSSAQAPWVRSKPILRVMQLKLHEPTMAIGYSLRMCARHVDSTNLGRSHLVFRSKPIAEAGMHVESAYSQTSRFVSVPGQHPGRSCKPGRQRGATVAVGDDGVGYVWW